MCAIASKTSAHRPRSKLNIIILIHTYAGKSVSAQLDQNRQDPSQKQDFHGPQLSEAWHLVHGEVIAWHLY